MITLHLNLDEAQIMLTALNNYDHSPIGLLENLSEAIELETEIQNMDLDDCAGGACKL